MIELKRCPFCGDEVEVVATGLYHWKYAIHHKNKTECILDANAFALPYEEEDAVRMWNTRADRKTEPTSSKMEQVEDEPKTQMKTQNSNLTFEKADEPQIEYCPRCGMRILVDKPKDEPQTEEHCETCRHKDECEGATYEYKNTKWWCLAYAPIDEPQTDCAWK